MSAPAPSPARSPAQFVTDLIKWFNTADNEVNGMVYFHRDVDLDKLKDLVSVWNTADLVNNTIGSVIAQIDLHYQAMRGPEQKPTAIHVAVNGTAIKWAVRRSIRQ